MQDIVRTLSWTFLHSLWQGLVAALLAAIIISSTRRAPARVRYNSLSLVMILFFVSAIITFFVQWQTAAKPVLAPSFAIAGEAPVIQQTAGLMDHFIAWVNTNSDMIILAWLFFFTLSCLRLITGLAAVNRLRHYKTQPVTQEWRTKLDHLQEVMGIRCPVALLESGLVKIPMALGILKPVILLPLGLLTRLPAEQVETILLHELAHIRRRDYLVNLLQYIAEAIFFFNPAIRWLSSLIRQEREACCDDKVVACCDQQTNYFNALVSFQEYSISHSPYAMGISCRRHYLLNRVTRMITKRNKGISLFEKLALLAGVLLFSAFSFVTQEKDEVVTTFEITKENLPVMEQPAVIALPVVTVTAPAQPALVNEKKKVNRPKPSVTDTLPPKKDTITKNNNIVSNKPLPEPKKAAADAKLQEIIDIKNEIGLKKETIGEIKADLKDAEGKEKEKMEAELERERRDLENKRKVLNIKRLEWDRLKKEAQNKPKEEKTDPGKTIKDKIQLATIKPPSSLELKTRHISADPNAEKFQIDNSKNDMQEFQYKMSLQVKDPLPSKEKWVTPVESWSAPVIKKNPAAPARKDWQ